jgi:hypothetical protein
VSGRCQGGAIGLVALDSATYREQGGSCGLLEADRSGTSSAHVGFLYWGFGFAIALLVTQAAWLVGQARRLREPPPSGYEDPDSRFPRTRASGAASAEPSESDAGDRYGWWA